MNKAEAIVIGQHFMKPTTRAHPALENRFPERCAEKDRTMPASQFVFNHYEHLHVFLVLDKSVTVSTPARTDFEWEDIRAGQPINEGIYIPFYHLPVEECGRKTVDVSLFGGAFGVRYRDIAFVERYR